MMQLNGLAVQLPLIGRVTAKDAKAGVFTVQTRGGAFEVSIKTESTFASLTNLDRLSRKRLPIGDAAGTAQAERAAGDLETSVKVGHLVAVEGLYYVHGERTRYEAMTVHVLKSHKGWYLFEHTNWWKAQIEAMANKWLDVLFGEKRTYALDDFSALYRTTLNIDGLRTPDDTQEMATLSRLIYGLSSAYLLGGDERYFKGAQAGVEYQREAFRSYSADGRFCFWVHARKRDRHGVYDVLPSAFGDDANTIPLYEQIYALAGLAQYYRITNDRETLEDIYHTLVTFETLFADYRDNGSRHDGYFSHIDPVTFSWDSEELEAQGNRARKNWNSIGDHLPAYLINLILALDPTPCVADATSEHAEYLQRILATCVRILDVTSRLIEEKFPEAGNDFVCERFERDWTPIKDWRWQKDRAIVGHNLKIAWNLTRVANYYRVKGDAARADRLFVLCARIGETMKSRGIDQIRSGVYDAVERKGDAPQFPSQFSWMNTKDFWQQEQGVLAYLIMYGHIQDPADKRRNEFLALARELSAVWNLYFLDRERVGIFFRVSDNGIPVLRGDYGDKGGHSISGYHAFELDYLAHVYQLAYLPRKIQHETKFCMHFRPSRDSGLRSINVLPDFLGPKALEVCGVDVDGVPRKGTWDDFQVKLNEDDLGRHVKVYLQQSAQAYLRLCEETVPD